MGGGGPDKDSVASDLAHGYIQDQAHAEPSPIELETLLSIDNEEEDYKFQAETSRLMDIIVNSLYSNREVFVRELISNSSDALSKYRHERLRDGKTIDEQLGVYVETNKEDHTVTIFDNGIGMSRTELIENLGTIARSGTHSFLETIADSGDLNVIGQFGVGFYSAFLVADDVIVQSRKYGTDDEYLWRSKASEGFTISKVPELDIERGTRVTLQLKEDANKYSRYSTVERLIRQHSEFIDYPVFLKKDDEWVHINPARPIWQRPKSEVSEEEYIKFYKKISKDYKAPLKTIVHNGEGEFNSVLYIPNDKDPKMWGAPALSNEEDSVKIYSRGVVISKEGGVLPPYLQFVHGVVESNDLPLKVDREQLTSSKEMRVISKRLTKKVIDTLSNVIANDEENGPAAWRHYSANLFIGCITEENKATKDKIIDILRFEHLVAGEDESAQKIRFSEYPRYGDVDSEDYDQKNDPIFYFWAGRESEGRNSPNVEIFKKLGIDVLFIDGTVADQCVDTINEYKGRPLLNIEKSNVDKYLDTDLEVDEEENMARARMMNQFTDDIKSSIMGFGYTSFDKVDLTYKLVDSPSAVFASSTGATAAQENHIRNQPWFDETEMGWRLGKKVLSINPNHPIVKSMYQKHLSQGVDDGFKNDAKMLYDFALLNGGHHLEMPELISEVLKTSMLRNLDVSNPSDYKPMEIPSEFYAEEVDEEEEEKEDDGEKNEEEEEEVTLEEELNKDDVEKTEEGNNKEND